MCAGTGHSIIQRPVDTVTTRPTSSCVDNKKIRSISRYFLLSRRISPNPAKRGAGMKTGHGTVGKFSFETRISAMHGEKYDSDFYCGNFSSLIFHCPSKEIGRTPAFVLESLIHESPYSNHVSIFSDLRGPRTGSTMTAISLSRARNRKLISPGERGIGGRRFFLLGVPYRAIISLPILPNRAGESGYMKRGRLI